MTDIMIQVEIPADVRDNSETVTDYAFMSHLSPHTWKHTVAERDKALNYAEFFGYKVYTWYDTNQEFGQRCRFDMLVKGDGLVVHLFHTEYFTRVACHTGDWCHSYATHYVQLVRDDGEPTTDGPLPYCGEHQRFDSSLTVHRSERLWIGQHD